MKRIAIVEDNPDNLELLTILLEDDYVLDAYEDGASALAGFAASRPDLVLMDISLPQMDGIEVLRRARARYPGLRAVALTAHAMRGDRERFLREGFDEYLSKPIVDEQALYAMIENLLRHE